MSQEASEPSNAKRVKRKYTKSKQKIFFTIDKDLAIKKNPTLNLERYYQCLTVINNKEEKLIQEYLDKFGKDAYLLFKNELVHIKQTNKMQKVKRFIGIRSLYEDANKKKQKSLHQPVRQSNKDGSDGGNAVIKQEEEAPAQKNQAALSALSFDENTEDQMDKYRNIKRKKRVKKEQMNINNNEVIFSDVPSELPIVDFFQNIQNIYCVSEQHIAEVYKKVCESHSDLIKVFEGNDSLQWDTDDDITLSMLIGQIKLNLYNLKVVIENNNQSENDITHCKTVDQICTANFDNNLLSQFKILQKYKGIHRVMRRIQYLKLDSDIQFPEGNTLQNLYQILNN